MLLKQRRQTGGELPVNAMGAVTAEPGELNGAPDRGLMATTGWRARSSVHRGKERGCSKDVSHSHR